MYTASGINFSVLCSANVDVAIEVLNKQNKISVTGTYKYGTCFVFSKDDRVLVDAMAEDICLSTRFLLLASNELHSSSKQELKNGIIKGDDKYPCTITGTIAFLQYHSLRGSARLRNDKYKGNNLNVTFAQT